MAWTLTLEEIEAAYRETGAVPTSEIWVEESGNGELECCALGAVCVQKLGRERAVLIENSCDDPEFHDLRFATSVILGVCANEVTAFIAGFDGDDPDDFRIGFMVGLHREAYDAGRLAREKLQPKAAPNLDDEDDYDDEEDEWDDWDDELCDD